jgi:hypothetical protein
MEQAEFTVGIRDLSSEQQQMVRDALLSILESPHFHKSKRYPALLEYAVRHTLEGNLNLLKERVIGAEVFGRPVNYDASNDAVVRSAAGEVRRRLALYSNEHPEARVRIDLPVGSYLTEFHFHSPSANAKSSEEPQATTGTVQSYASPDATHPKSKDTELRAWKAGRVVVLAAVLLLLVSGVVVWHYALDKDRGKREFWRPVLRSNVPALIVVGGGRDPALSENLAPGTNGQDLTQLMMENAIVTAQICSVFREYGRDCKVTPAQSATLADLHDKSIVLVGAFDNTWTRRLLAPLRYQFNFDTSAPAASPRTRMVVDHDHPEHISTWKVGPDGPSPEFGNEYAIVGRFRSEITDGMVVVAAGLGPEGTSSAGEFVCAPDRLHEVLTLAPKGWKGSDFEAVLQIGVVQGKAGHVEVVATQFW